MKSESENKEIKETPVKKSSDYNIFQVCNMYQINGVIRAHLVKKYKGETMNKTDWKKVLKKERIDF